MKKSISFLMLIVFCVSTFNAVIFATDETPDFGQGQYINFFADIEIFDFYYEQDAPINRAGFAVILSRLIRYKQPLDDMRGVSYKDVPVDYYASKAINLMNVEGIMVGKTEDMFFPEDDITLEQAAAAIVRLLGYTAKAGVQQPFPDGYMGTARELKMLTGVPKELCDDHLCAGALARMLYNILEVNIASDYAIIGIEKNLLNDYLNLKKDYGMVTGARNLFLVGAAERILADDEVLIGYNKYRTNVNNLGNYFGRYLYYYYGKEDDRIYAIMPSKNYKELTIYSDDDISVNGLNVEYYTAEGKAKRIRLSESAIILYNGKVISKLTSGDIPKNGYIKCISNNDSDYSILIIFDFQSFIVRSQTNGSISFEYGNTYNGDAKIDLNPDDANASILYNGEYIAVSDIKRGDAISVANYGKNYFVEISRKQVQGVIRSMTTSPTKVFIRDHEYGVNDEFYLLAQSGASGTAKFETNLSTTFYLDAMDKIVGMEAVSSAFKYGYLKRARRITREDKVEVKIYEVDNNIFTTFELSQKCKLNGEKKTPEYICEYLKDYLLSCESATVLDASGKLTDFVPPIIKYKHDGNGILTAIVTDMVVIDTVAKKKSYKTDDNRILLSSKYGKKVWIESYLCFSGHASDAGYVYAEGVPAIRIPQSGNEDDFYASETKNVLPHTDNDFHNVIFYDLDYESGVPGLIAYIIDSVGSNVKMDHLYAVKKVAVGVDCAYVYTYKANGDVLDLETTDDPDIIEKCKKLKKGDVIQCSLDHHGKIAAVEKFFSYSDVDFDTKYYTAPSKTGIDNAYDRLKKHTATRINSILFARMCGTKKFFSFDVIRFNVVDGGDGTEENPGTGVEVVKKVLLNKPVLIFDGTEFYKGDIYDISMNDYILALCGDRVEHMIVFKNSVHYQEFYSRRQD